MEDEGREKAFKLNDAELKQQDTFLVLMTGDEIIKGWLASSYIWYARHLQFKFRQNWSLIALSLASIPDESTEPAPGDLVAVYEFVIVVLTLFKNRRKVTLVEIVDELSNRDILKQQLDEDRAKPNQLVWATIGWLSMLYEAVIDPKPGKLEVIKTSTSASGYHNPLITRKYNNFKQGFDHIDSPFYSLLADFGDLIPEPRSHRVQDATNAIICAQTVAFHTLQESDIRIEWVTSLNLHLEFDSGHKTLKLFQCPSFCRLMIVDRNILSRLFSEHASHSTEDVRVISIPAEEVFIELLLSYRLIFSQHLHSTKAFSTLLPANWASDPLLSILCGTTCESGTTRSFYDELDAGEPRIDYSFSDFPHFGKRLLEVQEFVRALHPIPSLSVRSLMLKSREGGETQTLLRVGVISIILLLTIVLAVQIWSVQRLQQIRGPT